MVDIYTITYVGVSAEQVDIRAGAMKSGDIQAGKSYPDSWYEGKQKLDKMDSFGYSGSTTFPTYPDDMDIQNHIEHNYVYWSRISKSRARADQLIQN